MAVNPEWEPFIDHIYGDMSDEELIEYHQQIKASLAQTAALANDGNHRFDSLAPTYEKIIEDTEFLIGKRRNGRKQ